MRLVLDLGRSAKVRVNPSALSSDGSGELRVESIPAGVAYGAGDRASGGVGQGG